MRKDMTLQELAGVLPEESLAEAVLHRMRRLCEDGSAAAAEDLHDRVRRVPGHAGMRARAAEMLAGMHLRLGDMDAAERCCGLLADLDDGGEARSLRVRAVFSLIHSLAPRRLGRAVALWRELLPAPLSAADAQAMALAGLHLLACARRNGDSDAMRRIHADLAGDTFRGEECRDARRKADAICADRPGRPA